MIVSSAWDTPLSAQSLSCPLNVHAIMSAQLLIMSAQSVKNDIYVRSITHNVRPIMNSA